MKFGEEVDGSKEDGFGELGAIDAVSDEGREGDRPLL